MKTRRWIPLIFGLSVYLILESLCYVGLLMLSKTLRVTYDPVVSELSEKQKTSLENYLRRKRGEHVNHDPHLGWINTSEANSAGMRDDREYDVTPSDGVIRIAAFGDSFTYGSDVALKDTWEKNLTAMDPSIEVLNYGMGAYGLDQAYLRFLKLGTTYNPNIVFIGYMSENIARNVNVYRAFYGRGYRDVIFTKPRFTLSDGKLTLLENPLSTFEDYENFLLNDSEVLARLGENDYHYQINYKRGPFDILPSIRLGKVFWYAFNKKILNSIFGLDGMYNVESDAYAITITIFDNFYQDVLASGALPVILVFPDINDQRRSRDNKERRYTALLNYFRSKGYYFIDTLSALTPYESQYSIDDLVVEWGHYSPLGNKIIAQYILMKLKEWNLLDSSTLEGLIDAARQRSEHLGHDDSYQLEYVKAMMCNWGNGYHKRVCDDRMFVSSYK